MFLQYFVDVPLQQLNIAFLGYFHQWSSVLSFLRKNIMYFMNPYEVCTVWCLFGILFFLSVPLWHIYRLYFRLFPSIGNFSMTVHLYRIYIPYIIQKMSLKCFFFVGFSTAGKPSSSNTTASPSKFFLFYFYLLLVSFGLVCFFFIWNFCK